MLKLMIGLKGTGKTKAIIEEANAAAERSRGSVICIEFGKKLTFDIKHQVRLIDSLDYDVRDGKTLHGFICGLLAGNYDITDIFIDSALKICGDRTQEFEEFITSIDPVLTKNHIHCLITASIEKEKLSPAVSKFIQ